MAFLSENTIPFSMVFTKTDKLSANELQKNIAFYKKTMLAENWESMPAYFITSAEKRTGKEEILKFIEQTNELYSNHTA